jgi:hypothetical protein
MDYKKNNMCTDGECTLPAFLRIKIITNHFLPLVILLHKITDKISGLGFHVVKNVNNYNASQKYGQDFGVRVSCKNCK